MPLWNRIAAFAICWSVSASLFAAQISGTVTNGTTNNPAAGNEVVLLSLDGGMNEVSRATSDSQGHFTIDVPDAGAAHLLRVNFQGVNYFSSVPPGSAAADITIYNSAKQVEGIFEDARVFRMQTEQGQLEVSVAYTLRNESQPPRTKMDLETFTIDLPEGAQLLDATATAPGGMPVAASPTPTGKKNGYALVFPIRPGQTRFQVLYKMPYSGSYEFSFAPDSQLSELGVLLPKSMRFTGISRSFSQDADEAGLAVFFLKNVAAHEPVRFSVAGEGVAPREAQGGEAAPAPPANTPSAETANTQSNAFWYALAGMIVLVAGGAIWLWRRSARPPEDQGRKRNTKVQAGRSEDRFVQTADPQESMLDVLKDELFQLEQDRLDGKISAEEYEKSKAGLDALIRRQLKKTGQ
ncbi:MAG TPA: hypothetical protein VIB39_16720 [Candidatus Angelobacter sp.]